MLGSELASSVVPSPHLQRRVKEAQAFMRENLHRDVDLHAIAREASLSPYYFSRAFTAYAGVPPYRYLIRLRMERAQELLRTSELSVTQVCQRVGFNSLSHFTTTFHRHTGTTPTDYRRRGNFERDVRFSPATDALVRQPKRANI
ncbi:MAG: helix-turn-helix transcriptional regulator [Actinobacteria bacterium]|nr:helix-turn-helix transcriptional regulator [Actinomycetota bacterium]